MSGRLKAWDPIARKVVWESEPYTNAGPTSGVLATAGNLVFMGNGGGKILSAYDAKTGKKLWNFDAKTAVFAAPITYELDGVQYVAASVGGVVQGADYFAPTHARMLVFALGGKAVLPEPEPYTPPPLNPPPSNASAQVIAQGGEKYTQYCSVCHGVNGFQARSSFPNLTISPLLWAQEAFDSVVLQGGRQERGMGSFAKDLKPEDTVAIREYLISRAQAIRRWRSRCCCRPGCRSAAWLRSSAGNGPRSVAQRRAVRGRCARGRPLEPRVQRELENVILRVVGATVDELVHVADLEIVPAAQSIAAGEEQAVLIEHLAVHVIPMLEIEEQLVLEGEERSFAEARLVAPQRHDTADEVTHAL